MKEQTKTNEKVIQKDWSDHTDDDIVEQLIIKKAVPIGENGEVSVVEEVIEAKRYNRQDFINSFADDVGILNILKKVNAGLINPATLAASCQAGQPIMDISDIPTDIGDAFALVDDAHKLYATLPADLRNGMSFNEFCQKFDHKAFDAYIASKTKKEEEAK